MNMTTQQALKVVEMVEDYLREEMLISEVSL